MADTQSQKITIKIPLQEYGWISRYAAKNDMTMSQVVRKAIRMYITAVEQRKQQKEQQANSETK